MTKQGFSGLPIVRPYPSKKSNKLWTQLNHFYYTDARGRTRWAPKGMIHDFSSIPDPAEDLFDGVDLRAAGVIHDGRFLLSPVTGERRDDLDDLFVEMALFLGASRVQAWLADTGLQIGSWHSWSECQRYGVRWSDFDTSVLNHHEIAQYRVMFELDRGEAKHSVKIRGDWPVTTSTAVTHSALLTPNPLG